MGLIDCFNLIINLKLFIKTLITYLQVVFYTLESPSVSGSSLLPSSVVFYTLNPLFTTKGVCIGSTINTS